MLIQGLAKYGVTNDQSIWPLNGDQFQLSDDFSSEDVTGWPFCGDGSLQIVDTIDGVTKYTLQLGNTSGDILDLSRLVEQEISETASLSLPKPVCLKVPDASPYEVSVTGLMADQLAKATVLDDDGNVQLEQANAAPSTGEFQVDTDKIVFNADVAGKSIAGVYFETLTNFKTIGREAGKRLKNLGFIGKVIGPRVPDDLHIYVPLMRRASGVGLGSGTTQKTIDYTCILTSGYALPFLFYWDFGS